jgi:hypothetical protein
MSNRCQYTPVAGTPLPAQRALTTAFHPCHRPITVINRVIKPLTRQIMQPKVVIKARNQGNNNRCQPLSIAIKGDRI